MTKKILSFGALGLLVMTQAGCPSFSTFGLARTLNKGAVQGWVAPGGGGGVLLNKPTGCTNCTTGLGWPVLEGGVRVGVTDNIEVGGKLGFNGITGEGKFALVRSPTMDSGFNLSLNPGVGFIGYGGGSGSSSAFIGVLTFQLPILFGIDFGGHELVFGPRAVDQIYFGNASSGSSSAGGVGNIFYAGGSVGFAIRASSGFRIMPEVSLGVPVVASDGYGTGTNGFGLMIFQGGVAFLFGSSNQYDPPAPPPTVNAPPPPTVAAPPAQ